MKHGIVRKLSHAAFETQGKSCSAIVYNYQIYVVIFWKNLGTSIIT